MKGKDPNRTLPLDAHVDEVAIPEGLVEFLRDRFPYFRPRPKQHLDDIMEEVGFQRCIDVLEAIRTRQQRKAIKARAKPDQGGRV